MKLEEILEKIKGVNALLCEKDKEALYRYAGYVPENGVIVDIGTAAGSSAFIMALASKDSVKVYTVDPMRNQNFLDDRTRLELDDKIVYFEGTSAFSYIDWQRPIDLLFIDGVHSYQGVKDDFETFGTKVKPGGIVIFHDIFLYDNTIGAYVEDIVKEGLLKKIEIVDDTFSERRVGMFIGEKPYEA